MSEGDADHRGGEDQSFPAPGEAGHHHPDWAAGQRHEPRPAPPAAPHQADRPTPTARGEWGNSPATMDHHQLAGVSLLSTIFHMFLRPSTFCLKKM